MKKLYFSTVIRAPKEKVWNVMLEDATYREWTTAFSSGSHYVGDWSTGSKKYISIEHLGVIHQGIEDTTNDAAKKWAPAYENYAFKTKDGATEVLIDLDADEEYEKMFLDMWPRALEKLKALAEQ